MAAARLTTEVIAESLERVARGEPPIITGTGAEIFDAWNEKFVAKTGELSPSQVINGLEDSFWRFHLAFESFPEEKFDKPAMDRINFEISHYEEHTDEIEEWRKSQQ